MSDSVTPWTAACRASLSIINSQSLLKLMSIESVIPSNHLILCRPLSSYPQSFPALGSFQMSQLFASGGQSFADSASASVLPMNAAKSLQSCPTLCDPMNRSTPGLPVHHQLPEFTETHVHRVSDTIQPSHPLSSPSPPASVFPGIRIFSNESALCIRWSKYWSFSISPSK